MTTKQRLDSIMRDPLIVHVELKRRGSNFSEIARALSVKGRPVTPQHVRAAVYGTSSTHQDLILGEIRRVLSAADPRGVQLRA